MYLEFPKGYNRSPNKTKYYNLAQVYLPCLVVVATTSSLSLASSSLLSLDPSFLRCVLSLDPTFLRRASLVSKLIIVDNLCKD
ncbi:hypothetical protein ACS0TY_019743 [Phlomoides rotata]